MNDNEIRQRLRELDHKMIVIGQEYQDLEKKVEEALKTVSELSEIIKLLKAVVEGE